MPLSFLWMILRNPAAHPQGSDTPPPVSYTHLVTARDFESGVRILVIGLGSKVIIADRVGMLWNNVQTIGFNSISTPLAWLGARCV